MKEDAEGWLARRGGLSDRIVASSEREELWSRSRPVREEGGCENRLEEKVVDEMRTLVGILESMGGA